MSRSISALPPAIAAGLDTSERSETLGHLVERPYFFVKYGLESILAGVLFLLALPLITLLVVLVRITSPGPGIYAQQRVGRRGRNFTIYKLRSMRQDAEVGSGPVWATRNDARCTPLGAFLRRTHLDELPQLWNVVRGDMALVGPRPERPEICRHLFAQVPRFSERLAVKPGISGLAQINLPPDSDLQSVRRKLELDLRYIDEANFWLDFRIWLWSALRLTGLSASLLTWILGLTCRAGERAGVPKTAGRRLARRPR